ncbi:phytanoyl-CoA dioxygenase family protein, partial [Pluralibacter gergoviae]
MEKQAEVWLEALGAGAELTAKMCDELDTLGYTVVEGVADAAWLAAMCERIDALVAEEGDNLAIEHHQEATATRIANLVNKGVVWEKVWCHPLILSACRYVFNGEFKLSSLNAREALRDGGHQPLHADWKRPRADFPKVHLVNTIWAIDDLSAANGAPRIV